MTQLSMKQAPQNSVLAFIVSAKEFTFEFTPSEGERQGGECHLGGQPMECRRKLFWKFLSISA